MTEHKHLEIKPLRQHLDDERKGATWKLCVGREESVEKIVEHAKEEGTIPTPTYVKCYVITGEYDDGCLGEIFIVPPKEGSMMRGLLDGFATLMSISLQYGIPLEVVIRKFINTRFGPEGMTNDAQVPMATSIFDLICRKLALRYLSEQQLEDLGVEDHEEKARQLVDAELQQHHGGKTDGERSEEEYGEPAPEGWQWDTQRFSSGRTVKSLVHVAASCFSGRPDPADFAEAREGDRKAREEPVGAKQAAGAPGQAQGPVPPQASRN